jgi:glycosyltransferase involved in cell wall biosynthesis
MATVLLELSPLARPGSERGLGRYAEQCRTAAQQTQFTIREFALTPRIGRLAQFVDLFDRTYKLRRENFDLLHATTAHGVALTRKPMVASILDVIPLDLPEHRQTGIKAQLFLRLAARASSILTLSHFTKLRIVERLQVDPSRIFVGSLPPASAFVPPARGLPQAAESGQGGGRPYVSALVDLATPDPRKRPHWIAPLAAQLDQRGLALVVAGAGTEKASVLGSALGVGRVSDERLAKLYQSAVAFVYFSSYEGQGLPPMEAMASGAATIAVAGTAVTEVVGGAGILIDGPDGARDRSESAVIAELAEMCHRLHDDSMLRDETAQRGVDQTRARFTELAFLEALLASYNHARRELL